MDDLTEMPLHELGDELARLRRENAALKRVLWWIKGEMWTLPRVLGFSRRRYAVACIAEIMAGDGSCAPLPEGAISEAQSILESDWRRRVAGR